MDGDGPNPPVEDDHAATFVNDEINAARAKMLGSDLLEKDENWGIETFSRAVLYWKCRTKFCKDARCNTKGARCKAQGAKINQPRCLF